MLAEMGFSHAQARKALRETVRSSPSPRSNKNCQHKQTLSHIPQSGNAERAVEWLFSHPDDTGEDVAPPPPADPNAGSSSSSSIAAVQQQQRLLPARYRLRAFVSHKGPSVHSGHYVAHIRTADAGWVLFNDEKVVRADPESVRALKALAYLFVFERDRSPPFAA